MGGTEGSLTDALPGMPMRDLHLPGRSPVYGTSAAAATSHPLATAAALDALRDGGNAMDAAVSAAAVLAVVEPHSTGIGGDVFCLYAPGGGGEIIALNGSGRAPAAVSAEALRGAGMETIPFSSPHAVTVPGAVRAWERLIADHGRLDLARALAPAIGYATGGYPVADVVADAWCRERDKLQADPDAAQCFLPQGFPPRAGQLHRQPRLGETLQAIASHGSAAFYEGPVARDIVAKLRKLNGVHTADDFAAASVDYVKPVCTRYRGVDVYECPPNGQGIIALLMLNVLAGFDVSDWDPLGPERLHLEAEVSRLAYRERDARLADPEHADVPVEELLSGAHAAALQARIDLRRATPGLAPPELPAHRDTVYLTVVDSERNAVSFINSLFHSFGSGILAPASGVMLHNRGAGFSLAPGHPNELRPGQRPMHTIIPALAVRNGRAWMPFGVMGGHYQPVGQVHVLTNMLDFGMDVQTALDCPRAFHFDGVLGCERGVPRSSREALQRLGHTVEVADLPIGGGQAIVIDPDSGVLAAGSDPRKDGAAAAR